MISTENVSSRETHYCSRHERILSNTLYYNSVGSFIPVPTRPARTLRLKNSVQDSNPFAFS